MAYQALWTKYERQPDAHITELDFDEGFFSVNIKGRSFSLKVEYKCDGNVLDYVEGDLDEVRRNCVDMAREYFLKQTKKRNKK